MKYLIIATIIAFSAVTASAGYNPARAEASRPASVKAASSNGGSSKYEKGSKNGKRNSTYKASSSKYKASRSK